MTTSSELAHFASMAHYNQWMNEKLYEAAASLPEGQFSADRGAFFSSIGGTLGHLVLADTIWLQRFARHPGHFNALDPVRALAAPTSLGRQDAPPPLHEMRERRRLLDTVIQAWALQLRDDHLDQVLHYTRMNGDIHGKRFGSVIMHFFNHQTHHRGQASTLLHLAGIDIGETDLLLLIPEID